jgi:CBS domain containing-hemolysin-like protein
VPKIIAKNNADAAVRLFAWPTRILTWILFPLVWLVMRLINLLSGLWGKDDEDAPTVTEEELSSIIETVEEEGVIDEEKSELLQSAIDFRDTTVEEIMTPRIDMLAFDIADSPEEIEKLVDESRFSRLPVYEDSIDNIIGILYLNRFLKAVAEDGEADIRGMLMPPCYIYKTMKLPSVLSQLRRARQHLAVVTDEYGGTLGVVSMEDVLEQIVGEIWDDNDEVEPEVVKRTEGEYELDGAMMLYEMEELLGLPEDSIEAESNTVGGWTIECFGGFPQVGDSFEKQGLKVTVLEMSDGRRVDKVLVKRVEPEEKKEA